MLTDLTSWGLLDGATRSSAHSRRLDVQTALRTFSFSAQARLIPARDTVMHEILSFVLSSRFPSAVRRIGKARLDEDRADAIASGHALAVRLGLRPVNPAPLDDQAALDHERCLSRAAGAGAAATTGPLGQAK